MKCGAFERTGSIQRNAGQNCLKNFNAKRHCITYLNAKRSLALYVNQCRDCRWNIHTLHRETIGSVALPEVQ
jgi:hypothetical protein